MTRNPADDPLALRPMPEVAAALRSRAPRIIERWTAEVERQMPHARPLTLRQVRDSIPNVLEKIAQALESDQPEVTAALNEITVAHGVARFQESYDIGELLVEYRLLRLIIVQELYDASAGRLTLAEAVAVDTGVDIAIQQSVTAFVNHLGERLRSANEAESKYLSFLSHDLRNNLNGVTLSLDWLAQRLSASSEFGAEVEDLAALRNSVLETVAGMDRLLHAERLRKQAVAVRLSPVDLHRLAAELIANNTRAATEKGLRLENAVPRGAAAHSDRELIALVVQNLLGNAIKYSSRGTIRIGATSDRVGWRITVSDEGPGIAPEHIATLFEAFRRGETHGQQGVGLGLTIASQAARLLGSELSVDSSLGQGSTFSFSVPPAKPEQAK